jgi:hypothetical protein
VGTFPAESQVVVSQVENQVAAFLADCLVKAYQENNLEAEVHLVVMNLPI